MNLTLVAGDGIEWHHAGYSYVTNRRGDSVRAEHWSRPCRHCGTEFISAAVLPPKLWRRYAQLVREQGRDLDAPIRMRVPADVRMRGLELRNCKEHRWSKFVWGEELL